MVDNHRVDVLGVRIDPISFDAAVDKMLGWMSQDGANGHYVVTPNINHLVLYHEDERFRAAYSRASLVVADGRYIVLLSKVLRNAVPEPVNGSDLVPAIFDTAQQRATRIKVFLLGALEGVAECAAGKIVEHWSCVDIVGVYSPPMGFDNDPDESAAIRALIRDASPDLLVVGVSPPRQEIWLSENIGRMHVKSAICAGATIDFLAGKVRRAPRWMQRFGLEWVYRVMSEPGRLAPRYARDAAVMIWLLIREGWRRLRQ